MNMHERYNVTAAYCKDCGRLLKSEFGEPLGHYFVMDKGGNFYCTICENQFEDGDERIYEPEFEDEEEEKVTVPLEYNFLPVIHVRVLEEALIAQYGPEFAENYGELANVMFGDCYVNDSYKSYYYGQLEEFKYSWQDETQVRIENCIKAYLQDAIPAYERVLVDVSW